MSSKEDKHDITNLAREAAQALSNETPLLCDESTFRLQEAMQALELTHDIMDKCDVPISVYSRPLELMWRQDSELIKQYTNDIKVPPRPPPKELADEISPLPWESLCLRKARIISLEHIIRLESMLSGSDILESAYTSLYVHDGVMRDMKERLDQNTADDVTESLASKWAVFASSLILVKLCELMRSIIFNADIYEEEDFSDFSGGRELHFFPMMKSEDEVVANVTQAINLLSLKIFEGQVDGIIIRHCLIFQVCLYVACSWMSQLTSVTVKIKVEGIKSMFVDCLLHINDIIGHLEVVERVDITDNDALVLFQSFDIHMNRPLLGNHPVRKVVYRNAIESLKSIKNIVTDINLGVCDVLLRGTTLTQITLMLQLFSKASSNILGRSLMIYNLFFDGLVLGQYHIEELIMDHLHACGVPRSIIMADASFVHIMSQPIYNTLKLMTLNRNRQRSFIESCIIPEWVGLQREASAVDLVFCDKHRLEPQTVQIMSNYVLSFTVWIMEHYVSLGIELGLISQHQELSIALWYWDYLLSCGISVHTQMKKQRELDLVETEVPFEVHSDTGENIDYLKMRQMLSRGLIRLILALNQENILKPSGFTFTNHEIIFKKRFDAFSEIRHPTPLTYDEYMRLLHAKDVGSTAHTNYAMTCFKLSKTMIQKLQAQIHPADDLFGRQQETELTNLAVVCTTNISSAEKLLEAIKNSMTNKLQFSFDFETHCQFCCVQLS